MNKRLKFKTSIVTISIILLTSLIINPQTSVTSAIRGIKLWFDTVFPALFPFFVAVELLNKSGFVKLLGILMEPIMKPLFNIPGCGAFTFAIGLTSGYPMGAKVTSEMREKKIITKTEGERMLAYCNNSGPLFILGAVGVGMFKIPSLGNLLLFTHILACITVAFIFRYYKFKGKSHIKKNKEENDNRFVKLKKTLAEPMDYEDIGSLLGDSLKNSLNTILAIGGFIIFFSVIIAVLQSSIIPLLSTAIYKLLMGSIDIEIISAILCGFFEITTGSNIASATSSSLIVRASATAAIIGWAGLSVHAQVMSIISNTDLSPKPYLIGKGLQSIFACLYTFFILYLKPDIITKAQTVISIRGSDPNFLNGLYFNGLLTGFYKYSLYFLLMSFTLVCIKYLINSRIHIRKLF